MEAPFQGKAGKGNVAERESMSCVGMALTVMKEVSILILVISANGEQHIH
jgi:hypothetical protein